ncbi:hypothetical protein [Zavarzinia sp. CC-PAN008]|uniref:hypothetical protein n=1 Tax=Zavarzinia sp. CC-PAN008 TaxID=3243332 RepID=UPI003F743351
MTRTALPDDLVQALTALGRVLAKARQQRQAPRFALSDEGTRSLIARSVRGLLAVPAAMIGPADTAVPRLAALYGHPAGPPTLVDRFWPRPSDIDLMAAGGGLEYLMLFHRSGFVREAALGRLGGGLPTPFAVAAIALRLNDWVPQVADAAERALARTLPGTAPAVLAGAAVGLIPRLDQWQRWTPVRRAGLAAMFRRPDVAGELFGLLTRQATGPMAATLRFLLQEPGMDGALLALAQQGAQAQVRAVALETLLAGSATWVTGREIHWIDRTMGRGRWVPTIGRRAVSAPLDLPDLLAIGLADRAATVRKVAGIALVRRFSTLPPVLVADLTARLAADGAASVRGIGAWLQKATQPA